MIGSRAWLCFGVLATCGCGGVADRRPPVARRDSAGIEIVTSTPQPDAAPTRVFDSLPLFDIGADQSDPHQEFQRPTNPIRLSDGRIVVGDHGTNEIRFYDSTGRWLSSVGRKGSGPGEFEDLAMVFLGPADSLYAIEPRNGRVNVIDRQGRFGRTFRPEFPGQGRFAMFQGVLPSGDLLINGSLALEPKMSGLHRSAAEFFRYRPDGKKLDSLTSGPSWEALVEVAKESIRFSTVPFSRSHQVATQGQDVILADTERFGFTVIRPGVGPRRIVRIELRPSPITEAMYERAVDRQFEAWGDARPDDRAKERAKLLAIGHPRFTPAIDLLTPAADGSVWLREYLVDPDGPARYSVVDTSGAWTDFIVGPAKFRPTWIGAHLALGTWLGEDDVAHIRAYRLRPRPK